MRVNGRPQPTDSKPGSFVSPPPDLENRRYGSRSRCPSRLYTEGFRDNPRRFAFLHGPLVLSAEVDAGKPLPVIVCDQGQLLPSLKPVAGKFSTFIGPGDVFRIPGAAKQPGVVLEPFYKMHGGRHYEVYWDSFTPAQWQARQAQYEAEHARENGTGCPHRGPREPRFRPGASATTSSPASEPTQAISTSGNGGTPRTAGSPGK